ncbi:hypothetical protein H7I87_02750 [Mycobacterium timonense]|uniref:Uncharacterized protein n=1 Tax=Mycobacterium bouchedurhonense TaxID=701041 RepID=A0AAW5SAS7_MYCBC|nr:MULTISPECIES: hypothetical protein [Mycobacterium avium complex (MAC)]MCV6991827.1 hypothetical protein [Mycobacterium bouchedurhonense]MCV6993648.1 hypothetical protein [Mycobacterium timonense]
MASSADSWVIGADTTGGCGVTVGAAGDGGPVTCGPAGLFNDGLRFSAL